MMEKFNYIITIHNKEDILEKTLAGVAQCCGEKGQVFPVLDGCTDGSEEIVDRFSATSGLTVNKIYMPDVHMLRSVNAALKELTGGFAVILQDDVILREPELEKKISALYKKTGPKLGVVSLRLAANVRRTPLLSQLKAKSLRPMIEECDYIQSPDDVQKEIPVKKYEIFYPRMVAINGPNVVPETVRNTIGILDDNLAPFGYDDPEYCLRALKAGFINGMFPLPFISEIGWGGTRRDPGFAKRAIKIHRRNRKYIWQKHGEFISEYYPHGKIKS